MDERKGSRPLYVEQIIEILDREQYPVSRLVQFPPTLARYFSEPGIKERIFTHSSILAFVAGTLILTSR